MKASLVWRLFFLKHGNNIRWVLGTKFGVFFRAHFHKATHSTRAILGEQIELWVFQERASVDAFRECYLGPIIIILLEVWYLPVGPHKVRDKPERVNVTQMVVAVLTKQLWGCPSDRTHPFVRKVVNAW